MKTSLRFIGSLPLGMVLFSLSCTQPGYRNEVYPGQQGQYVLKQVPVSPSSAGPSQPAPSQTNLSAPQPAPTVMAATVPQADGSDTDEKLATLKSLWPRLSQADRAAVVDLTRHLASPPSP
jgi:hypothetical protein